MRLRAGLKGTREASGGVPARCRPHRGNTAVPAAATAAAPTTPREQPYGGAIVAKLAGKNKFVKDSAARVVPILLPGADGGSLPFSATLECVSSAPLSAPDTPISPQPAHTMVSGRAREGAVREKGASVRPPSPASNPHELLDVYYILSGSGKVVDQTGGTRTLHAGDSLVVWHDAVLKLSCGCAPPPEQLGTAAHPPAGPHSSVDAAFSPQSSASVVALKFHFPASLLLSGTRGAGSLQHSQLQVIVDECAGAMDGELTQQDADEILRPAHRRAQRMMEAVSQVVGTADAYTTSHGRYAAVAPAAAPTASASQAQQHHADQQQRQQQAAGVIRPGAGFHAVSIARAGIQSKDPGVHPAASRQAVGSVRHLLRGAHSALSGVRHTVGSAILHLGHAVQAVMPAMPQVLPQALQLRQLHMHAQTEAMSTTAATTAPSPAAASTIKATHASAGSPAAGTHAMPTSSGHVNSNTGSSTAGSGSSTAGSKDSGVLLQRAMEEFRAFRFPRQTNQMAFVFDPSELGLSMSFGVEVFDPGHHTPLHIHKEAHELFFVLAGEGVAFCNGSRFEVAAGDCVVFPPRSVHGIDNASSSKLYCLQLMVPNESFVEYVQSGEHVGRLGDEDMCNLIASHC